MRLKLVPSDTSIDFLRHRRLAFIFSVILVLSSIGLLLAKGLNLGIDFRGGICSKNMDWTICIYLWMFGCNFYSFLLMAINIFDFSW